MKRSLQSTAILFDQSKQLLKMNYRAEGRDIVVTMDPK
jgi:hypothetical protein